MAKEKKEVESRAEAKKDTPAAERAEGKKKGLTKGKRQMTSDGWIPQRRK